MYAIIKTGGKQYKVKEGDLIKVEKLTADVGEKVVFTDVLAIGEGSNLEFGSPYLEKNVFGEVVGNGKGDKVIIFKYKAKKDYRKKQGHRQPFTQVQITGIGKEGKIEKAVAEKTAEPKVKEAAPKKEAEGAVSMSMKKDELIAFASEKGIEVDPKATKQIIIDKINESL